jgi:hypothetical protein
MFVLKIYSGRFRSLNIECAEPLDPSDSTISRVTFISFRLLHITFFTAFQLFKLTLLFFSSERFADTRKLRMDEKILYLFSNSYIIFALKSEQAQHYKGPQFTTQNKMMRRLAHGRTQYFMLTPLKRFI